MQSYFFVPEHSAAKAIGLVENSATYKIRREIEKVKSNLNF